MDTLHVDNLYCARGSGGESEVLIVAQDLELDKDAVVDGVYSVRIAYYGDAPDVAGIEVVATSEEKVVSAYEAVRATLAGLELFPGPVPQKEGPNG